MGNYSHSTIVFFILMILKMHGSFCFSPYFPSVVKVYSCNNNFLLVPKVFITDFGKTSQFVKDYARISLIFLLMKHSALESFCP